MAFDPTQITFLGTSDGDIPLVMGSLPEWESDPERANETGSVRALGLPEEGRILLLMTGSMGFGDVLPLPEPLCGIAPDVRMTPILLKPTTDVGRPPRMRPRASPRRRPRSQS